MNRISASALALAVFAAGCYSQPKGFMVGPDYVEPEINTPEMWSPDAGFPTTNVTATGEFKPASGAEDPRKEISADKLDCWWCAFDDPVLTNLMNSAVSGSLSFQMAMHRLEQARWACVGAGAGLMPKLNFGAAATSTELHRNTSASMRNSYDAGGPRASHTDLFQSGFDASWELDVFGGRRREIESAVRLMEAANFTMADAWVTLTAEICRHYLELRKVQQRLEVARANLKLQTETYEILKTRLDSGIGDQLAVSQSKYIAEETRAIIPGMLVLEEQYMNALAVLVGTMPGALHEMLRECPARDWIVAPQRVETIPLNVMRARPDVKAAERRLAAQVSRVGVAKSLLFPKFYINGTLGLESAKVQKFFQPGSLYATIGPSVSWPIFQGGNIVANMRVEEAKMDEAICGYELAVQSAFQETRNAYSAYTQEFHRYRALQAAVKAAKDAETISRDLYKNGLADFNNVLDAQRSLLTFEEALVVSRSNISINLVSLYKALGGGFRF